MGGALRSHGTMTEQDQRISEAISRDEFRLREFIRKRVSEPGDAEDILQDVFYELVEAYRLMKPVEQVTAWLFRIARNRIIDLFRKRRFEGLATGPVTFSEDGEPLLLTDLLPSRDAGPEAAYARTVVVEELDDAPAVLHGPTDETFPIARSVFQSTHRGSDGEGSHSGKRR